MTAEGKKVVVSLEGLSQAFLWLKDQGYTLLGPKIQDGAVIYDRIEGVDDLPAGWTDVQLPGKYSLKKREDNALFGFAASPHSWKKFLFPPERRLWQAAREGKNIELRAEPLSKEKFAFIGVRSCELHAMAIQDKVFLGGEYTDPFYKNVRENAFIVGVNCGTASGTCFCVSMNTGPKCTTGFDVALTEFIQGEHEFLLEAGSSRGERLLANVRNRAATPNEERKRDEILEKTASQMGREMNTEGIKELLARNYEHPRWKDVASRCLTCANCTLACPTCFCSTVEDTTDLTGDHAERWRRWDSCFTMDFSYVHGGSVRATPVSRYRQWMTHKLGTWHDQFGSSGCVGCGRCITWCPVGIDITEEVRAIRETEMGQT